MSTPIIPIYREGVEKFFVAKDIISPAVVKIGDVEFLTSPLAINTQVDLLGISSSKELLDQGLIDMTDTIDLYVSLKTIYLKIGKDIFAFNVTELPTIRFHFSTSNNYRTADLDFNAILKIDTNTKCCNDRKRITTKNHEYAYNVRLSGKINFELGTLVVACGYNKTITVIGYDINADRVNPNRRENG